MKGLRIIIATLVIAQFATLINAQAWGVINDQSVLRINQTVTNVGGAGQPAAGNASFAISHHIVGMRATNLLANAATVLLSEGGVNSQHAVFQFNSPVPGQGYSFRIEVFSGAMTKTVSILLIAITAFMIKVLS